MKNRFYGEIRFEYSKNEPEVCPVKSKKTVANAKDRFMFKVINEMYEGCLGFKQAAEEGYLEGAITPFISYKGDCFNEIVLKISVAYATDPNFNITISGDSFRWGFIRKVQI